MYGELMGETPPINFTALATTGVPTQGTAMPWTNATVQALYPGLDSNAADALMFMVGEAIYKGTVADILQDSFFSDGPYKTQTVNNWLFGWFDPVSFAVSEDPTAPSAGWAKLKQTKPTMVQLVKITPMECQPDRQQLTQYVPDTTLTATKEKLCLKTVHQNYHGTTL